MIELAVIVPLEPMRVGDEFADGAIPLHVTVLPNVRVSDAAVAELIQRISSLAADTSVINTVARGVEIFGQNLDVVVTTIDSTVSIRDLHARLLHAAHTLGAESMESAYTSDGYRPHITHTPSGQVPLKSDLVMLNALVTVDCTSNIRRIISLAPFGGNGQRDERTRFAPRDVKDVSDDAR
jgi:2'-5' RNA ligase